MRSTSGCRLGARSGAIALVYASVKKFVLSYRNRSFAEWWSPGPNTAIRGSLILETAARCVRGRNKVPESFDATDRAVRLVYDPTIHCMNLNSRNPGL